MRPGESFSTQMHREYALWTRFSCHPTARPKFGGEDYYIVNHVHMAMETSEGKLKISLYSEMANQADFLPTYRDGLKPKQKLSSWIVSNYNKRMQETLSNQ